MRPWPPKHKQLAMVMILVLIACTAAYLFVVSPRKRENARLGSDVEDLRKRLGRTGWPLHAERLEAALEQMKRQLEGAPGPALDNPDAVGVKARSDLVLARSTAMFDQRIRTAFGNADDFILNVSRLDYQTEFNRLQQKLAAREIWIVPDMLNLAEDTSSPYTYQLVLQVWTLDILTDLILENGLTLLTEPTVTVNASGSRHEAARISMHQPRAYYVREDDPRPYLLEFPVRVWVTGTVEQTMQFIRALTADGQFLPVSHLQVFAENPGADDTRTDGTVRVERVRLDIECGAFFQLKTADPASEQATGTARPQGV